MTIRVEQVFLSASPTTSKIVDIPPGPGQVILSALQSGAAVSYGPVSGSLTSTTGGIVNAGQSVTIVLPPGSGPQVLFGTGIGGTAIISSTISTPN